MNLGERILEFYEDRTKQFLMKKTITILRLDGKGFSKFTKDLKKPFDDGFSNDMDATAIFLCESIQGAKFAYTQSDEITVVLTDFDTLETDAWFDYNVQKMTSIAASLATAKFNEFRLKRAMNDSADNWSSHTVETEFKLAFFDCRVFQVPNIDEMINTIIWRQQDCTRNSISMAAHAYFPNKRLDGVSGNEKQEMLFTEKGINWDNYLTKYKRGSIIKKCVVLVNGQNGQEVERNKWLADVETPIFTQDKEYLYNLIPTIKR